MNHEAFRHSARNDPLNDSMKALSVGLPGREKSRVTPLRYAHRSSSLEMNSGPLSNRIVLGLPWVLVTRSSVSTTSEPR